MDINKDKEAYLNAWAEMMMHIWRDKISKLRIGCTNKLYMSFKSEIITQSNGDITKIQHSFKYYGIFVDMGVGRGVRYDDQEDGFAGNRKAKKWWLDKYETSAWVLRNKIREIYGEEFTGSITTILEN